VARDSDLGRAFTARVSALAVEVAQRRPARLDAAIEIAKLAELGNASPPPAPGPD
jgi:hypothetical protein